MEFLTRTAHLTWFISGALLPVGTLAVFYWYKLRQLRLLASCQTGELMTLRRELSHRVNTNLAVVISLLELQLTQTPEDSARLPLLQSLSRIRSVALLQERLYERNVPTPACINLRQYVQALYQALTQQTAAQLNLDLDTDELAADLALPLGLILHELMADATRHAAPQQPALSISLKQQNGWLLELLDKGPTLEPHHARWTRAGVPLPQRLIEGLSEQVGGACAMLPGQGMHFRLHIAE